MEILNDIRKYFNEIVDLAYKKYTEETENHDWLEKRTKQSFELFFKEKSEEMQGIVGVDAGDFCGFLLYTLKDGTEIYCDIPVWGYGADGKDSMKIMSCFFQHLAEKIVLDKKVHFSVRLYAHDDEIQKLFSFMQFGIQSEKGIRRIGEVEHTSEYKIRELSIEEVEHGTANPTARGFWNKYFETFEYEFIREIEISK